MQILIVVFVATVLMTCLGAVAQPSTSIRSAYAAVLSALLILSLAAGLKLMRRAQVKNHNSKLTRPSKQAQPKKRVTSAPKLDLVRFGRSPRRS